MAVAALIPPVCRQAGVGRGRGLLLFGPVPRVPMRPRAGSPQYIGIDTMERAKGAGPRPRRPSLLGFRGLAR